MVHHHKAAALRLCTLLSMTFPVVEVSSGCRVLSSAVSAVLDILGWTHAKEGDKTFPFASTFDVLGVNFDLRPISDGCICDCQQTRVESKNLVR